MTSYRELSRRGLINMCMDYDIQHEDQLKVFLQEHDEDYESIRAGELALEKADQIAGAVCERFDKFKRDAIANEDARVNKLISKLAGGVVDAGTRLVLKNAFK